MAIILHERSIKVDGLQAQCPKFKCSPLALFCCTRQILYNQPDFHDVDSLLEIHCRKQPEGYLVVFLPKFHCKLNPIEQCWAAAKHTCQKFPATGKETDLDRNVITAMNSSDLLSIRRYVTTSTRDQYIISNSQSVFAHRYCICSNRFINAYCRGLMRKQAAWAAKKYHGHQVLPDHILSDLTSCEVSDWRSYLQRTNWWFRSFTLLKVTQRMVNCEKITLIYVQLYYLGPTMPTAS